MPSFYLTTAIAYVNSAPHMGHALEFILADTIARYHRLKGDAVHFLTGTDEHGSKIFKAAQEAQVPVQDFVNANAEKFRALKNSLQLSWDDFIRTSDSEKTHRHHEACQKLWRKLNARGDLEKRSYTGLYCEGCERFMTEKELDHGNCPIHHAPPQKLQEENWFFLFSHYAEKITDAIQDGIVKIIPEYRANEILELLKNPTDVSFSRPKKILPWGIEVPNDPEQTMYVWCDALTNYISGIGYADSENPQSVIYSSQSRFDRDEERIRNPQFMEWWSADEVVHVIGKDILRFHAGIWLGMLLSADLPMPKKILVHGFITASGEKMSKSLGNVADPFTLVSEYGTDALRYFLLSQIPVGNDGDFTAERFREIYNAHLANGLGNLLSRVITLALKLPANSLAFKGTNEIIEQAWKNYTAAFEKFNVHLAAEEVFKLVAHANKIVDETKLWELVKNDPPRASTVLSELLEILKNIAILLAPLLPETSGKIRTALGLSECKNFQEAQSQKLGALQTGVMLFPRKRVA
jgi:methionyl-tRNA synthetase